MNDIYEFLNVDFKSQAPGNWVSVGDIKAGDWIHHDGRLILVIKTSTKASDHAFTDTKEKKAIYVEFVLLDAGTIRTEWYQPWCRFNMLGEGSRNRWTGTRRVNKVQERRVNDHVILDYIKKI